MIPVRGKDHLSGFYMVDPDTGKIVGHIGRFSAPHTFYLNAGPRFGGTYSGGHGDEAAIAEFLKRWEATKDA